MKFKNRIEAGKRLAERLSQYRGENSIVFALPRGGVVTAAEIARYLHAPLDLVITRKIGHPHNPEYAIAAIGETGQFVGNPRELDAIEQSWLDREIEAQRKEIERRTEYYLRGRHRQNPKGKIAILVDDGVATGLTLRAGILELKQLKPRTLIIAVPVIPLPVVREIDKDVDEVIALDSPGNGLFFGSVSSYYDEFPQIDDNEVITLLEKCP